ncbi:MAG TPA: copper resistance protein [Lichenihabitans sp.]|jgi:uncharacterized cupredoxin-like copper-binding protein|nr:copper resistance protein [Lichenihabitans sp.]
MRALDVAAGLILAAALAAAPARAAENTVQVDLQDASIDGSLQGMRMKLDRAAMKAGPVTFRVANRSKALIHEMVILRTNLTGSQLPYDSSKDIFVESRLESLGEVPDLSPGKSGQLTLYLKPGPYLLTCNQPGHLHAGMWARFTVMP